MASNIISQQHSQAYTHNNPIHNRTDLQFSKDFVRYLNAITTYINNKDEWVHDTVAELMQLGIAISWTYDDDGNKLYANLLYNNVNLQITGNAINTIQDIHTSANPTFSTVNARLQTPAGSSAAGTALIKMSNGTLMANTEANAIEYDGENLSITPNTNNYRYTIPKYRTLFTVLNFANATANTIQTLNVTFNGAKEYDRVVITPPIAIAQALNNNGTFYGYVTALNTVAVTFHNIQGTIDLPSGNFRIDLLQD